MGFLRVPGSLQFGGSSASSGFLSAQAKHSDHRNDKKQFHSSTSQFIVFSHIFRNNFLTCLMSLELNQ